jgi:hypothetical protein
MKYFKWKAKHQISNSKHGVHQAQCRLCQFLQENEGKGLIVSNLTKWWLQDSDCHSS